MFIGLFYIFICELPQSFAHLSIIYNMTSFFLITKVIHVCCEMCWKILELIEFYNCLECSLKNSIQYIVSVNQYMFKLSFFEI